jgi:hypothetical protein
MLATLDEIGKWTAVNGEGIYGSRPWKIFGERPAGAATVKSGDFNEDQQQYTASDIRFTTKGDSLYAFLLDAPKGEIRIKSLGKASALNDRLIKSVKLLGSTGKIRWKQEKDALVIEKPAGLPDWKVLGIKVELGSQRKEGIPCDHVFLVLKYIRLFFEMNDMLLILSLVVPRNSVFPLVDSLARFNCVDGQIDKNFRVIPFNLLYMLNGDQHFFPPDPIMRIDYQVSYLPGFIVKNKISYMPHIAVRGVNMITGNYFRTS